MAKNLSGVWQGKYSYAAAIKPNSFAMHLSDEAGALRGEIIEPNAITPSGPAELIAGVTGTREAQEVVFTKTYSDIDQPSLRYEGHANADLTRVDGTWHFPSEPWMHGRFMMVREVERSQSAKREIAREETG